MVLRDWTPGPWVVIEADGEAWLWQEGKDLESETGEGFVLGPFEGFRRADVDLIVASPTLASALRRIAEDPDADRIEMRMVARRALGLSEPKEA